MQSSDPFEIINNAELRDFTKESSPTSSGLKSVEEMSDRELLEEIVTNMRFTAEALAAFQNGGMGKMMMSMLGSRK